MDMLVAPRRVSIGEKDFVQVGLDRERALHEDFLQHGRLHLRLVRGANGAASSVVVTEAR